MKNFPQGERIKIMEPNTVKSSTGYQPRDKRRHGRRHVVKKYWIQPKLTVALKAKTTN